MKYPISREDALIAHTRNNAYILNRENDLGSIAPGKLADLFIADRDYLTVPAERDPRDQVGVDHRRWQGRLRRSGAGDIHAVGTGRSRSRCHLGGPT